MSVCDVFLKEYALWVYIAENYADTHEIAEKGREIIQNGGKTTVLGMGEEKV